VVKKFLRYTRFYRFSFSFQVEALDGTPPTQEVVIIKSGELPLDEPYSA